MDNFQTIKLEIDNRGIATITLARPQKHNAMNAKMLAELTAAAEELRNQENIRACVLQAQGPNFCAGADLNWMKEQLDKSREGKMAQSNRLAIMLQALDDLPMPLIGKIQGSAYGGGIGLMAVCDVVIADYNAKFALTETKLGLIPATIGPFVIRRIGEAWARQYFFSAKPFDAATAEKMNLVSAGVDTAELDDRVDAELAHILKCKPGAVAQAKLLAKKLARDPTMETLQYTANKLADRWETQEAKDAIEQFFASKN